jgi:hypothetical protein
MATKEEQAPAHTPSAKPPIKLRQFAAPAELAAEFNPTIQEPYHFEGLVPTERLQALLDAFGVPDIKSMSFPLQRIKRQHGEIWRIRIDPASVQMLEGKPANLHRWSFVLDSQERVSSAN